MNEDHGELSPEARALVTIGRDGDEPSAIDRARVRAKVIAGIAGGAVALSAVKAGAAGQLGAGTAGASSAGAAGASSVLSAKLGVGALALALATAGAGVVVMRATQRTPPAQQQVSSASKAQPDAVLAAENAAPADSTARPAAARERAIPKASGAAPASTSALERTPSPASEPALEPVSEPVARRGVPQARLSATAAASEARSYEAAAASPKDEPRTTQRARAPQSSRVKRSPSAARKQASATVARTELVRATTRTSAADEREPTPSLRRELTLIAAAQAALARNAPDEALRWLDAHAAGYASGELVEERLAARAVALCALGREVEGKRDGAELTRIAPNSPLVGRARRACAAHEP